MRKLIFEDLKFECPLDCGKVIVFMEFDKHVGDECKNAHKKCENKGCGLYFARTEFYKHKNECKYEMIKCEKCNELVKRQQMHNHLTRICERSRINC